MSKFNLRSTMFVLMLVFSQTAFSADMGKQLATKGNGNGATACIACHGTDGGGQAQAGYPRIAGMNQTYLEKQLHDFADGSRKNSTMQPIAKALKAQEVKAVAEYFSQLPIPANHDSTTADKAVIHDGKKLAVDGHWSKDVPACLSCHGPGARGVPPHFPMLAGQHEKYIVNQLQDWQSGNRNNDPNQLMKSVASRLSHDEIMAVGAYLASLNAKAQ